MALKKKMFTKRKIFTREEIGANLSILDGKPKPREVKSQVAQQETHPPSNRKDVKTKMSKKLN